MSISQMQIVVKNTLPKQIMKFLADFYFSEISPLQPVCILANVVDHASPLDPIEHTFTNWKIAQLSGNQIDASRKLAEIIFSQYPAGLTVIFEFDEVDRELITPFIDHIQKKLHVQGFELVQPQFIVDDQPKEKPKGPTIKTVTRAEAFKKIKDEHLEWNMERVAAEYNRLFRQDMTGDTVRNAFRAMGWHWDRSDRIR
jgi:hypothetical protein